MVYEFVCPDCKQVEGIQMTVDEYTDLMQMPQPVVCIDHDSPVLMRRKFSAPGIQIN